MKIVHYFELYYKPIWLIGVVNLLDALPNWHKPVDVEMGDRLEDIIRDLGQESFQ